MCVSATSAAVGYPKEQHQQQGRNREEEGKLNHNCHGMSLIKITDMFFMKCDVNVYVGVHPNHWIINKKAGCLD